MTRFLFTTLPTNDLGLLTRSLPIARELVTRGHHVSFCNPASAPRRLIADGGFENIVSDHPIFALMADEPSARRLVAYLFSGRWRRRHATPIGLLRELLPALPWRRASKSDDVWDMDHAGALMGMLNPGFVRAQCDVLKEQMVASRADVVVDFWNPFAVIAARSVGLPLVTVIQADAHPRSEGFIWWKPRPASLPTTVPVVNKVLKDYGLPAIAKFGDLSVGDLTLAVGSPETDPLPSDAAVTYVGTTLWQKAGDVLPDDIEALPHDRPLVWVYSGNPRYGTGNNAFDSRVVLEAAIAALTGMDANVVLTTGHHSLPPELLPLPANMIHVPYVPGLAMAARSDLLIHHGGYGSCQTGLHAGKPAVILPTFSERESNARRIAAAGAGVMVPVKRVHGEKRVDPGELRAAVEHVLADPAYGQKARRIGEALRGYGGAVRGAELIERFAQQAA